MKILVILICYKILKILKPCKYLKINIFIYIDNFLQKKKKYIYISTSFFFYFFQFIDI